MLPKLRQIGVAYLEQNQYAPVPRSDGVIITALRTARAARTGTATAVVRVTAVVVVTGYRFGSGRPLFVTVAVVLPRTVRHDCRCARTPVLDGPRLYK